MIRIVAGALILMAALLGWIAPDALLMEKPAFREARCGAGQRSITPQATRAPEFPAGSVFSSSGSPLPL